MGTVILVVFLVVLAAGLAVFFGEAAYSWQDWDLPEWRERDG